MHIEAWQLTLALIAVALQASLAVIILKRGLFHQWPSLVTSLTLDFITTALLLWWVLARAEATGFTFTPTGSPPQSRAYSDSGLRRTSFEHSDPWSICLARHTRGLQVSHCPSRPRAAPSHGTDTGQCSTSPVQCYFSIAPSTRHGLSSSSCSSPQFSLPASGGLAWACALLLASRLVWPPALLLQSCFLTN